MNRRGSESRGGGGNSNSNHHNNSMMNNNNNIMKNDINHHFDSSRLDPRHSQQQQQQHNPPTSSPRRFLPDHGETFLPTSSSNNNPNSSGGGSGGTKRSSPSASSTHPFPPSANHDIHKAPEPLDHFKRGYNDRAVQRERETNTTITDKVGSGGSRNGEGIMMMKHPHNNPHYHQNHHNKNSTDRDEWNGRYDDHHHRRDSGTTLFPLSSRRNSHYEDEEEDGKRGSNLGRGGSGFGFGGGRGGGRGGDCDDRGSSFRRSSGMRGSFQESNNNNNNGGSRRPSSLSHWGGDRDNRGGGGFVGGFGAGVDGGRGPTIIMGLDIGAVADRLVRPGCDVFRELDDTREDNPAVFQSGKAVTAILSNLARRRNLRIADAVWDWMDSVRIDKNTFHYNSMISVCEKVRDYRKALRLLDEMNDKKVAKNEVTFSSAISACEKCGQWRSALDLLEQMKREGSGQTAIAYNAAISACEKGLVPHKALEIFDQMKREGIRPTVVTYSALISACEKGQQWKLALDVLEEMKTAGHGANVIAYSAAISALSKGGQWRIALDLFREIESTGGKPSIVTYNATMTALEKGLQWERALDLFDEMKTKNMPVTVVSYGSAISACEKGKQYRQCLEYLDEMTEMGIKKNVIIFGAAMSCMEKSCRADIAFQLMERMKHEDVAPNVHIYNSAISACARCNLWKKGHELFKEMDDAGVDKDVVTYNAVLDAVSSQVKLGRTLFKEGVDRGFYARVSRVGSQWLELDLHFLSLGGGEIALGWWFEECLVPYMVNTSKLEAIQSIAIVTGYGKTRSRGARMNDDGMRLRVRAMLKYMNIKETPQPNKGRIHIDKDALVQEVKRNNGRIRFDIEGYTRFKEEETTSNKFPDVPQQVRPRFRPARPEEGPPGTFIREGDPLPPYKSEEDIRHPSRDKRSYPEEYPLPDRADARRSSSHNMSSPIDAHDRRVSSSAHMPSSDDREGRRGVAREPPRRGSYEDTRGSFDDTRGRASFREPFGAEYPERRRPSQRDYGDRRAIVDDDDRRSWQDDMNMAAGSSRRLSQREREFDSRGNGASSRLHSDSRSSFYGDDRRGSNFERSGFRPRDPDAIDRDNRTSDRSDLRGSSRQSVSPSNYYGFSGSREETPEGSKKRPYDEYQKQQTPIRGYDVEPSYAKRRSM